MTERESRPERFGPYRVLERIGEGGMGVVFLATDAAHRKVAVKALRPAVAGERDARRRLAREVETMRRVRSPFVAEVLDADVNCDPPYIVTQYVHGRTLDQVVTESGPLRGVDLARLARGAAAALSAVHAAGVVHRDLKPGNIMLSRGEPVVIDFGIAHSPESSKITQTGMFMGTPGYLAPEVIEGKDGGPASDVHSWGATLAFAATGRPPFGAGSFETIFYRIVHGQPDLTGCPPALYGLLSAALARDPAHRPSAAELATQLATLDPAALVAAPGPAGLMPRPGMLPPPAAALAGTTAAAPGLPGTMADWARLPGPGGPPGHSPQGRSPQGQYPPGLNQQGLNQQGMGPPGSPGAGMPLANATRPLSALGPGGPGRGADGLGATGRADLLPDVQYGPPGALRPGRAEGTPGGPAAPGQLAGLRPLFVLAVMLAGVGLSMLLPVAGTAISLTAIAALRAGTLTGDRLRRRRTARGERASDGVVSALTYPLMLAWSGVIALALAPVALVAAGIAATVTILIIPAHPFPQAVAYGAGALVACYGLGPGSQGPRQQLGKAYDAMARSAGGAAVALIVACALSLAAIVTAVSEPAFYWPVPYIGSQLDHLKLLHGTGHSARSGLVRILGRLLG